MPVEQGFQPTPEEYEKIKTLVKNGSGIRALSKIMAIGPSAARRLRDRALHDLGMTPSFRNLNEKSREIVDASIRDFNREALKHEARNRIPFLSSVREWVSPVDGPIGLTPLADIHFGGKLVDYDAIERDTKILMNTEGLYAVIGGDGVDNHIKHLAAIIAQSMTPGEQWAWFSDWIETIVEKLIAIVGGNHDYWTCALTGYDPLKEICKGREVPYDPDQIAMDLTVGDVIYRVLVRHKYRFNSSLNPAHSVKRMYDMLEHFDVGIVCDQHENVCENFKRNNLQRWAIRPGSYQISSSFSRFKGFPAADPVCPVAVFMPDEREIVCIPNLKLGAMFLRAVRADWKRRNRKR
jgi:hypothetical protein